MAFVKKRQLKKQQSSCVSEIISDFEKRMTNGAILINFDSNATTEPYDEVLEKFLFWQKCPNVHNNLNIYGKQFEFEFDIAKNKLTNIFKNTSPRDFYFTSGASESNKMAILLISKYLYNKFSLKPTLITSTIEHKSLIRSYENIDIPLNVVKISPDINGKISAQKVETEIKKINSSNFFVSIMSANNETGIINDIDEIGKVVKKYNGIFHTDATQFIGRMPIDKTFKVKQWGIHSFSLSFHKLGGLIGSGLLYLDTSTINLDNFSEKCILICGTQQNSIRGGTINPGLVLSSVDALIINQIDRQKKSVELLKYKLFLIKKLQKLNFKPLLTEKNFITLPNTLLVSLGNFCAHTMAYELSKPHSIFFQKYSIIVGAGSACNTNKISYVFNEMKFKEKNIIRISLSDDATIKDCKILITIMKKIKKEMMRVK